MQQAQSQVEKWQAAAASVKGEGHIKDGAECDDAWFVGQSSNGFIAAIVSDGAGSATFGGLAAREICASATQLVHDLEEASLPSADEGALCKEENDNTEVEAFWAGVQELVEKHLAVTRERLIEHASTNACNPSSYLATVVGVIAHADFGVMAFHLGDGAATVFDTEGVELLTSQPENGEYLNQTYFLVEDWWKEHLRVTKSASLSIGSIFLMTDGVTELAYQRRGRTLSPSPTFFGPLISYFPSRTRMVRESAIQKFLDTERARELVDDDKTLVWISPS